MKTVKGNLVKLAKANAFDVIVQGCNIYHTMGAGVALDIAREFPEAVEADKKSPYGDWNKLGTFTYAKTKCGVIVVNAYTQGQFGGKRRHLNYEAVYRAFESIAEEFKGLHIGFPAIGAGLAGGNWKIISTIIEECLSGKVDFTFVEYDPKA